MKEHGPWHLSLQPGRTWIWGRLQFGGLQVSEAKRLRELKVENAKLKKLLAEAHLDVEALKVAFGVKR